jgi:nicotinamide-nucleotide adenylyltransferase
LTEKDGSAELPALFVGRFQPFHNGHLFMTKKILEDHDKLIIGVGSAQYSHTRSNPFSYKERLAMISQALEHEGLDRCSVLPIDDVNDHETWVSFVESVVPPFGVVFSNDSLTVGLFRDRGHDVREPPLHDRGNLSGTEVRERMVSERDWESLVPKVVVEIIREIDGVRRVKETHIREE